MKCDSKYVTTSAMWDQLNIFVTMCKLYYVRTCSKQCKSEVKLCQVMLQHCFADLKNT